MRLAIAATLLCAVVTGCSRYGRRTEQYGRDLNPLIGVGTKEQVAAIYGMPLNTTHIGKSEHWLYKPFLVGPAKHLQVVFDEGGILQSWAPLPRQH